MLYTEELLALQRPDGSWGQFHTLSMPTKAPPTTEQALRRLRVLGYTAQDEPIQRAIAYMERHLPEPVSTLFFEKKHDPKIFADLMLATWLRLFVPEHPGAMRVARQWAALVEAAFQNGERDHALYLQAFQAQVRQAAAPQSLAAGEFRRLLPDRPAAGHTGSKDRKRHARLHACAPRRDCLYLLGSPAQSPPGGIRLPPGEPLPRRHRAAGGLRPRPGKAGLRDGLARAKPGGRPVGPGPRAKDGVYLPLSGSWRRAEGRRADCTARIMKLLEHLRR